MGKEFSVIDVLPRTGTIDDARVFGHLHAVQKLGNRGRVINAIEIVGCCNQIAGGLVDKLNALLPNAKVVTISQVVSTQRKTNSLMHNLSFVFLIVIVLVGGASIANYMYSSTHERRREIGTLMALGATPRVIVKMFLMKAFVLGILGGVMGAILGSGLAVVLGPKIAQIPVVPIGNLIWLGMGLSVVLSLVASVLPSLKAAKIDPCVAIQEL
jgi:putative ABC transport system permease protein